MSDTTDYDPVECPAGDCAYSDAVRSVAAHVSGRDDDAHSWDRLGYDGAREFVMTEKRRQRGELQDDHANRDDRDAHADRSGADPGGFQTASDRSAGGSSGTDATVTAEQQEGDEDDEDFELGFERDAVVLLALASRYDLSSLDDLGTGQLADLYSLLADLKNSAEDARKEIRDALLEQLRQDTTVSADLGTVDRRTYEYRRLRDEAAVRDALDDADVDPESVTSFDKSKLKDAVEESDLDEAGVFDVDERAQIRISESNDDRRRERFDRLDPEVRSLADDE